MKDMKAARWYAEKDIRVEQAEIPTPKNGQIKIAVKFAGICGSDLHEYVHGPQLIPTEEPYLLSGHKGVTTLGHEFSGIVEEVGENANGNFKKGDRVVVEPIYRNPDSPFLTSGEYNLSEPLGFIGLSSNGGFANYVVVEDYMVHKIPDSMSFEQGALVEPAAVAVHAVLQSGLKIGQTVLVSGAGPIGLLCVQAAIAAGATTVIVTDVAEKRLEKAKEIGATYIISATEKNIPEQIKKLTNGLGVDVYLDAAGVQASYDTGLNSVRNGGTAVLVALFGKPVTANPLDQVLKEITIKGVIAYRNIFPQVIALIDSGRIPAEKLITSKIKLDEIVDKGFEALVNNPAEVKILIDIEKD
ncbi:(R,R)-butanediol dehydrogenase / meso-butanediol dehydrogenase / diacetyl reductase [Chishuiella changwenlii]|uniref:Butanediol dehydrogenase n=1 Tax=Chishuiella changwenlii TaxID=1434701 RepID=A0A1M7B8N3_9FLAO|nr:2,3-butanediol dehydrogenase [Chishuiella changwenlii]GGE96141.1 butanediol dehydrogenase [Chishuiella changwenlii]SHL51236.1 (R,R)-butanediol dehydrogenase / meso-butanediol dehydrogenase / diacetyl reductase [Chishuiella changwenlii]